MTKEYRKGQIIFSEGEPSRGLCLVADGTVKLHRVSPNGREILLRVVQTGDSFAEEAAFVPCYSASAQALAAATQVVWFERHGFQQLLAGSERLSLRIFETLALRVCQLTDTQADHKLKEASARLASYLLSLSAGADGTIPMPMSKTVIAASLGTAKETLSRLLRRFTEAQVLANGGNHVRILARARLEKIARGEERI